MRQVDELTRYWSEQPPTHIILAARYLKPRPKKVNTFAAVEELSVVMGVPTQKMPDAMSEAIAWAEQQKDKLKVN